MKENVFPCLILIRVSTGAVTDTFILNLMLMFTEVLQYIMVEERLLLHNICDKLETWQNATVETSRFHSKEIPGFGEGATNLSRF